MPYYERVKDFRINLGARKKLGQGSQGTVYLGISLITKDRVAAKRTEGVYKEYFNNDEFEKEADLLLNRIQPHENIIKVFDFTKTEYEDKGIPKLDLWLITELCEFGNLKEFAYSRDLSIEQKIELMYQSALAVRHLHGCKPESVAHRDVKPENILLTGNEDSPTVKLCDFGSAKSVTRTDGKSVAMTTVAGTRRYQAPEQIKGYTDHSKYGKLVDIFSLGITFLALLKAVKGTLMSPETIDYKGLGEIMWIKHKNRQEFSNPIHEPSDCELVSAVKAAIEKMIRFEPSSRLSAAEVVEELSKVRKGLSTPKSAPATVKQPRTAAVPQPAPAIDSKPAPATDPSPVPARVPKQAPTAVPSASPATIPQPAPATDPQPAPATDPPPVPARVPKQAPTAVSSAAPGTVPQPAPATVPKPASTADPPPVPARVPKQAPTAVPRAAPATIPQPAPAIVPKPASTADPPLVPARVPKQAPTTVASAAPATIPQPAPATDPPLASAKIPQPAPTTVPRPSPDIVHKPVPTAVPQPAPATFSKPPPTAVLQPAPATVPQPARATDPQPARAKAPQSAHTIIRQPASTAVPQPAPATFPQPAPATVPQPAPATDPQPTPATVPQPASAIVTRPAPATVPQPAPATVPQPAPATVPQPARATVTHPAHTIIHKPASTAVPQPAPATVPQSAPATVSQPAPATDPQPTPAIVPQPASAIVARPAPATVPQPAPATVPQPARATVPQPARATDPQPAHATETWLPETKVVALRPFKATNEEELSFKKYNVLTIIKSTRDPNWYQAEDQSGKFGRIPSNYVRRRREVQLQSMPWLHGEMTWRQAHALLIGEEIPETMTMQEARELLSQKDVGTFLVHAVDDDDKKVIDHKYTLHVVRPDRKVEHYRIVITKDRKFTINGRLIVYDLQQLVQVYGQDANGLCTNLQKPLVNECDLRYVDSGDFLREGWTIRQSEINVLDKRYAGQFSDTHNGVYLNTDVFITKRKDPYTVQDARIGAAVLTGLSHKNLVQLIGVVLGDIVTEFLSKGRLYDYLHSQGPDAITGQDQMSFAKDVCHGMKYLEQKNIVHRCLWARGILLSQGGTAKVGDFIFAHPVDRCKRVEHFPVRWSTPEAMSGGILTSKSDVWSFGVLLWEIYSYEREPYPDVLTEHVRTHIVDGGRLEVPYGCPDEIFHVMLAAWNINPTKRPTFSDVCKILDKLEVDTCKTCLDFLEEDWNISRTEVRVLDHWYTGFFTDTYKGGYSGRDVFIIKRNAPYSVQNARIEAAVMTGLSHKNLVQLIGVVLGDETLIVTEFLSKGRLYNYLRSQGPGGITSQDQMSFARDVCNGMQYLEQKHIVHRYLLGRSVMLSEGGTAKVGDFILAHRVDRCKRVKHFPHRWSAPEALRQGKVTSKSDVWSFGVLLWEIYSCGLEPYPGIHSEDILAYIVDGGRLEAPDGCPDEIYHVMLAAWDMDPAKRPTFSDVCEILDSLKVPEKQQRSSAKNLLKTLFRR